MQRGDGLVSLAAGMSAPPIAASLRAGAEQVRFPRLGTAPLISAPFAQALARRIHSIKSQGENALY